MSKILQQKKKKDSPRETLLTIFVGTFLFFEFGIDDNSLAGCVIGEPDPDETSTGTSKGLKEAETLKEPELVKREEGLKEPELVKREGGLKEPELVKREEGLKDPEEGLLKEAFKNLDLEEVGPHQEVLERMRSLLPEVDGNKRKLTQEESFDELTNKFNIITASFEEVKRARKAIDTKNP